MTALDVLAVLLRAGGFILLFQAAGAAFFIAWQANALGASLTPIARLSRRSALLGMAAVLADGLLAPARMAGELAGVMDPALQHLAWLSAGGAAVGLRLVGLALLSFANRRILAGAGALLALASFPLTGHTTTGEPRWLLAALLAVHVAGVTFWLGSLEPLVQVVKRETAARAGEVIGGFSKLAGWVVAALFIAALGMAVALLAGPAALLTPYGALLLTKLAGFTALLALASVNRWHLAPGIGRCAPRAAAAFTQVVRLEQLLIVGVVLATSVMTSWFSPS
jgi:putative copper resistance protein D